MTSINLSDAEKIISGARQKMTELNLKMSISVVDPRGDLIAMIREDGSSWRTPMISHGKAVASACFGLPSVQLEERASSPIFNAFTTIQNGNFIMGQGALPIFKNGELVGAVGASGGLPQEDEDVVQAGIDSAGLKTSA
tara:strand:+ start:140 stop:556 length:417 start_codon:yes stop_codon:yes gene_type:complete